MVLFLACAGIASDGYTSSRSLVFGGGVGMYDRTWLRHDNSHDDHNRTFDIDVFGGYFIKDNLAFGIKAGYSYSRSKDRYSTDEVESEYSYKDHLFKAGFFLRNYFRISRPLRFFIETELTAGFGGTEQTDSTLGPGYKNTADLFTLDIGFVPGLVFFINRGLAVEARIGFVGLTYRKYEDDNQVDGFEHTTTDLDLGFDVDSLRIQLGMSIYL